jgi:hypothetical protein
MTNGLPTPTGKFARILALIVVGSLLAAGFSRADVTFTATLDRDTITVGEGTILTLRFEGGSPRPLPALPAVPNLSFSYPPGRSTQISIINGQQTSSESYSYTVTPAAPGEYAIPAISASVGSQTILSQPVKLRVLKAGSIAPISDPRAFIKLIVPKTNVYVGEVLPLEIQLYVQLAQLSEFPKLKEEGFILGRMPQPAQSSTVANGQRYNVLTFKSYVVPAKVGKIDLGPVTLNLTIGNNVNFFNQLVDGRPATIQSEPQTLTVMPLPSENVPPGFSGAVGDYALDMTVAPTNVAVGEPVTITVRISGRGPVESLTLPEQPGWQQFKLYPPTSDFEAAPNDVLGLGGTKVFKLTAVPESMEVKALPPFNFSFFNPDQKIYRTISRPATPLIVRPSAASLPFTTQVVSPAAVGTSSNQDIVHIKPRLGVVAQISPPLVARPWFLLAQFAPVLAWLGLLINRKRMESLAANPRLRRQRLVQRIVRDGLKQLKMAAQTNQPDEFFAIVFRLLQEQIGERFDVPASAITEAIIEERLRPLQMPEETLELLRELFQACNQARYARQASGEELMSLVPRVEDALREVEQLMP